MLMSMRSLVHHLLDGDVDRLLEWAQEQEGLLYLSTYLTLVLCVVTFLSPR